MKIYFVILHYQNSTITLQCVEYIKKLTNTGHCHIVIVDNASPNKSGVYLKKKYLDDQQVKVVCNKKNLGFAKGNNIGYRISKDEGAEVIIVLNSDILIKQKDFIDELENSGLLTDFHIIGPDIINKKFIHQNPLRNTALSGKRIEQLIVYHLFLSVIYSNLCLGKLYVKIKMKIQQKNRRKKEDFLLASRTDAVLHGSCLIYTKKWIECEDTAFLPITYMYGEEDILYEYAKKRGYQIIFYPKLKVLHEEDASIDFSVKNDIEKRKFISKNMVYSFSQLKKLRNINR